MGSQSEEVLNRMKEALRNARQQRQHDLSGFAEGLDHERAMCCVSYGNRPEYDRLATLARSQGMLKPGTINGWSSPKDRERYEKRPSVRAVRASKETDRQASGPATATATEKTQIQRMREALREGQQQRKADKNGFTAELTEAIENRDEASFGKSADRASARRMLVRDQIENRYGEQIEVELAEVKGKESYEKRPSVRALKKNRGAGRSL